MDANESKMKTVEKTENGDLPKLAMNAVFSSSHSKRMLQTKRKNKDRSYENQGGGGATLRELRAMLENFWMSAHPRLDRKSPMEILMRRKNILELHQSFEHAAERE
ncbi:hypothetical protein ACTXT7_009550 [Hymenolepis weldensis]